MTAQKTAAAKATPGPKTTHANIAAALAAFQAEVPKVEKGATAKVETRTGGSYTYQYADLAVVTEIAMPLLGRHGLAFTTRPTLIGDRFALHYALIHEGGEVIEGEYPLQDPTQMKPQEVGSAITYARRYTFCAVTGIAPGGDDDDANSVNDRPAAQPRRQPAPPQAPAQQGDGLEHRAPQRDWLADAAAAKSVVDLRVVFEEAGRAGDLNVAVKRGEEFVALGALLKGMKEGLPEVAPEDVPAAEAAGDAWAPSGEPAAEATGDWPVAQIPEDGS